MAGRFEYLGSRQFPPGELYRGYWDNRNIQQPLGQGSCLFYELFRLEDNDDFGGTLNSRIQRSLSAGTYLIQVRSVNGSGSYSLQVSGGTPTQFSVTSVSISLSSARVGSGSISGTGSGTVEYHWITRKPGGIFADSGPLTVTMSNGSATIPSYSNFPTDLTGEYSVFVRVTSPTPTRESNTVSYMLTAKTSLTYNRQDLAYTFR